MQVNVHMHVNVSYNSSDVSFVYVVFSGAYTTNWRKTGLYSTYRVSLMFID